jgi:hypothetical protein
VSGTQICTGRSPAARIDTRYFATRSATRVRPAILSAPSAVTCNKISTIDVACNGSTLEVARRGRSLGAQALPFFVSEASALSRTNGLLESHPDPFSLVGLLEEVQTDGANNQHNA